MAATRTVRIPIALEWASIVRPGDTLIIGLADADNVSSVATAMQAQMEPLGVKVVVVDNVRQIMVARPKGDED